MHSTWQSTRFGTAFVVFWLLGWGLKGAAWVAGVDQDEAAWRVLGGALAVCALASAVGWAVLRVVEARRAEPGARDVMAGVRDSPWWSAVLLIGALAAFGAVVDGIFS